MKRIARKGYQVYAVHVEEIKQKTEEELLEAIPVIREFKEIFPKEIPHLPPKREIDFFYRFGAGSYTYFPSSLSDEPSRTDGIEDAAARTIG